MKSRGSINIFLQEIKIEKWWAYTALLQSSLKYLIHILTIHTHTHRKREIFRGKTFEGTTERESSSHHGM